MIKYAEKIKEVFGSRLSLSMGQINVARNLAVDILSAMCFYGIPEVDYPRYDEEKEERKDVDYIVDCLINMVKSSELCREKNRKLGLLFRRAKAEFEWKNTTGFTNEEQMLELEQSYIKAKAEIAKMTNEFSRRKMFKINDEIYEGAKLKIKEHFTQTEKP
jgi:hypothetical protein